VLDPLTVTGTGRVCGESASSAPARISVSTPAHVRLDPVHEHDVPAQPRGGGARQGQPGGRPDQPLGLPGDHLDHGPVHLEVVEVIRVDGGDGGGLPRDAQVVDYAARGFRRVIPPLESGDRHRMLKRAVDVAELDDFTSS
jgi:hypothetical protein